MPDFDLDSALEGGGYTVVQTMAEPPEFEVRWQAVAIGRVWLDLVRPSASNWVANRLTSSVILGQTYRHAAFVGLRQSKEECVALLKDYHSRHPEVFDA